jgi:PAS domain S-box-containing protein
MSNQYDNHIPNRHRQKAEEIIKAKPTPQKVSEPEILNMLQELQVHQIELQMQNEELLQAKDRAELAEKKYTELYDGAPSGYLVLSKEGDIVELNYSAARLLYKERPQLIKNRFALFISEESQNVFLSFFDRVFKSRIKETCELVTEITGQPTVYLNIDGIISKDNKYCLLTMVDISENKRAEQSLFQLKLANEALKFKQSFLANISHEIRTPLTGILGVIEILQNTELSTTQQKEYIDILKHSSDNLREIINQVLDYSKIEAGKVKLKPSLFETKVLLDETEILHKGIVKHNVHFTTISDHKIPAFIYADEGRIRQVINNFIFNALKFTKMGSVILSSQLLSTDPSGRRVMIKISVTDTGIGIPVELQNKLFIPFSQIDDLDSRGFEGTGLGLSICKELVKLLGGEIGVSSEYMKGSTFWFTFPALINSPAARRSENGGRNKTNHKHNLNILFAEDKTINQKVIGLILTSLGHVVTIAENGKKVLRLFEPNKYDLILMDIQMPEMDGITATKKLKEKHRCLPPIIGLSANAFEGDREKYMALGMDEYLTKPFKKEEFIGLINKLWSGV